MVPYVAIIPDGNGRWATMHGKSVTEGHEAGGDVLQDRLRDAVKFGVKELTIWTFSTENWSRPKEEVDALVEAFLERLKSETEELNSEGVRMRFIGRRSNLSQELQAQMAESERITANNDRITVFVGFNYGGRAEIVDAARSFNGCTEEEFRAHLYAPDMHDPDLIIRTGGDSRLSNFLSWQCAYSELYFSDVLWPDFSRDEFEKALSDFGKRNRRFGGRDPV